MKLYTYYRSSSAYRVRIALNIKHLTYELCPIHLLKNQGENWQPEYLSINPQGLVPALEDHGQIIIQSQAIIDYLEETYPEPRLYPESIHAKAYVRALSQIIDCEIHPLNNLRVLNYLADTLKCSDSQKKDWYCKWVNEGFIAIERFIEKNNFKGRYCCGDDPTLADIFLVPQVYNAKRFGCDMSAFPLIKTINNECMLLHEFISATPENQPDAN